MFKGVFPAIITPFKEDESLDEEGLKRNIEYLNKTGIAGIVPCGTTGESATLTFEEHKTGSGDCRRELSGAGHSRYWLK